MPSHPPPITSSSWRISAARLRTSYAPFFHHGQALIKTTTFVNGPTIVVPKDQRAFYAMATYKVTAKLTGGMYYSSSFDEQLPQGSARYQKDWTMAARYDCTPYLYLKAEQHVMDGTEPGFSITDNVSLQPNTLMTLLKLGVSF